MILGLQPFIAGGTVDRRHPHHRCSRRRRRWSWARSASSHDGSSVPSSSSVPIAGARDRRVVRAPPTSSTTGGDGRGDLSSVGQLADTRARRRRGRRLPAARRLVDRSADAVPAVPAGQPGHGRRRPRRRDEPLRLRPDRRSDPGRDGNARMDRSAADVRALGGGDRTSVQFADGGGSSPYSSRLLRKRSSASMRRFELCRSARNATLQTWNASSMSPMPASRLGTRLVYSDSNV